MTKREKLIAKIRARPVEAEFADVKVLLEFFGWKEDRIKGSHHIFFKPGQLPISVPTVNGRKVKQRYLNNVCVALGLDDEA